MLYLVEKGDWLDLAQDALLVAVAVAVAGLFVGIYSNIINIKTLE